MQWLVSEFNFSNVAQIDNGNFAAEPVKAKKQPGRMPKPRKRKYLAWQTRYQIIINRFGKLGKYKVKITF